MGAAGGDVALLAGWRQAFAVEAHEGTEAREDAEVPASSGACGSSGSARNRS